ncbi:MAG: DUF4130 domain-containing protein, partial [Acetobacteraceae bacterium]
MGFAGAMRIVTLRRETDWDGWRAATRALVLAGEPPEALAWVVDPSVPPFADISASPATAPPVPRVEAGFAVPRALVALAAQVIQARDPERFALLYGLVWRVHAGMPVLADAGDPALRRVRALALAVRAEAHRMRALIRYLPAADGTRFLGWYTPAHFVLEANAPLLARWYPGFAVSILTPDGSAHWSAAGHGDAARPEGTAGVAFGPAVDPAAVPDDAALRAYWTGFGADLLAAAAP